MLSSRIRVLWSVKSFICIKGILRMKKTEEPVIRGLA